MLCPACPERGDLDTLICGHCGERYPLPDCPRCAELEAEVGALGSVVDMAKAYVGADGEVRGSVYRELCAAVAALKGDFDYSPLTWPAIYARWRTRAETAEAEVGALAWCRDEGADVEFNYWPNEPPEVVVIALDEAGADVRATAPTFLEAVAKCKAALAAEGAPNE